MWRKNAVKKIKENEKYFNNIENKINEISKKLNK